jgi:futalosine hydrolase
MPTVHALLKAFLGKKKLLLVVPAPVEARAVLRAFDSSGPVPGMWGLAALTPDVDMLLCGVSKANAAGGVAQCLTTHAKTFGGVINIGIAGSLTNHRSAPPEISVGMMIVSTACIFADEGIVTAQGFADVAQMGFPIDEASGVAFACEEGLVQSVRGCADASGPIATVSTCSGTDDLARAIASRTHALAESMEGAAVALVCKRAGVAMCEARAVSNFTGARAAQAWDIPRALARLERFLHCLVRTDV